MARFYLDEQIEADRSIPAGRDCHGDRPPSRAPYRHSRVSGNPAVA